jgi:hypothetical protein
MESKTVDLTKVGGRLVVTGAGESREEEGMGTNL